MCGGGGGGGSFPALGEKKQRFVKGTKVCVGGGGVMLRCLFIGVINIVCE